MAFIIIRGQILMSAKHKVLAANSVASSMAALVHASRRKSALGLYKVADSDVSSRNLPQEIDASDKMTWGKAITLTHRIAIYCAAVYFLKVCVSACIDILRELQTAQTEMVAIYPIPSLLIGKWVGTTTVRASPLLVELLGDYTAPRNGTLYLDLDATSLTSCSDAERMSSIYLDNFQRRMFKTLVSDTSYALTFFDPLESELVLPVVDCTFRSLVTSDNTLVRFFYLVRSLNDTENVYLVIVSLGMQDLQTVNQINRGPAAVATVVAISSLTARSSVEHHFAIAKGYPYEAASFEAYKYLRTTSKNMWLLQSHPFSASAVSSVVTTSYRLGFYRGDETRQANYKNALWELPDDPLALISSWNITGRPILTNSSAWVHLVFFYLTLEMLFHLHLINMLTVLSLRKGRVWIHDGFSAIATKLSMMAPVILLSWVCDGGWTILELAMYDGNMITEIQTMDIRDSVARADLLVLCYSIAAMVGSLTKTRIDPFASTLAFYLIFEQRHTIVQWLPAVADYITAYTNNDYDLGRDSTENTALISALAHWGSHEIKSYPLGFVCANICAIVGSYVVLILTYMACCKIYRRYQPEKIQFIRATNRSLHIEELLQQQRTLTTFEIATGAQLLDRYGLISDYHNYIFVRGVKFATTDGIYASGFAIANDKFVLQAQDLPIIWLMKATGIRLKDIYAYPLSDKTVRRTAELVYPYTLSAEDLTKISIRKLI